MIHIFYTNFFITDSWKFVSHQSDIWANSFALDVISLITLHCYRIYLIVFSPIYKDIIAS